MSTVFLANTLCVLKKCLDYKCILKKLKRCYYNIEHSQDTVQLLNKSIITPAQISSLEIKSLLWTAFEIKKLKSYIKKFDHIAGANVTFLLSEPNPKLQIAMNLAAKLMQVNLTVIIDNRWEGMVFPNDFGKMIATNSEILMCNIKTHTKLQALILDIKNVPVVNLATCRFVIPQVLSDILTLQLFHGHLNNLNVGWIGVPCCRLNTYLCIMPRLGMNIHYYSHINNSGQMSPMYLPIGKALSDFMKTKIVEYCDITEILKHSNVIVTRRNGHPKEKLTLDIVEKYIKCKWSLIHILPRDQNELGDTLFFHENNIIWKTFENLQYILCAIMLRVLKEYKHITPQPSFDTQNACDYLPINY